MSQISELNSEEGRFSPGQSAQTDPPQANRTGGTEASKIEADPPRENQLLPEPLSEDEAPGPSFQLRSEVAEMKKVIRELVAGKWGGKGRRVIDFFEDDQDLQNAIFNPEEKEKKKGRLGFLEDPPVWTLNVDYDVNVSRLKYWFHVGRTQSYEERHLVQKWLKLGISEALYKTVTKAVSQFSELNPDTLTESRMFEKLEEHLKATALDEFCKDVKLYNEFKRVSGATPQEFLAEFARLREKAFGVEVLSERQGQYKALEFYRKAHLLRRDQDKIKDVLTKDKRAVPIWDFKTIEEQIANMTWDDDFYKKSERSFCVEDEIYSVFYEASKGSGNDLDPNRRQEEPPRYLELSLDEQDAVQVLLGRFGKGKKGKGRKGKGKGGQTGSRSSQSAFPFAKGNLPPRVEGAICSRCGRDGHTVENCITKTDRLGKILWAEDNGTEWSESSNYWFELGLLASKRELPRTEGRRGRSLGRQVLPSDYENGKRIPGTDIANWFQERKKGTKGGKNQKGKKKGFSAGKSSRSPFPSKKGGKTQSKNAFLLQGEDENPTWEEEDGNVVQSYLNESQSRQQRTNDRRRNGRARNRARRQVPVSETRRAIDEVLRDDDCIRRIQQMREELDEVFGPSGSTQEEAAGPSMQQGPREISRNRGTQLNVEEKAIIPLKQKVSFLEEKLAKAKTNQKGGCFRLWVKAIIILQVIIFCTLFGIEITSKVIETFQLFLCMLIQGGQWVDEYLVSTYKWLLEQSNPSWTANWVIVRSVRDRAIDKQRGLSRSAGEAGDRDSPEVTSQ